MSEEDPPFHKRPGAPAEEDPGRRALGRAARRLLHRSDVFLDAADPIFVEDLEGRIIDLSDEAARAYGWTRKELLGQPVKTVVPPEWREHRDELVARCRLGEAVRDAESVRWTRERERIPVLLTLSPVTDPQGSLTGIATTARDISKLKEHRAVMQEIEAELPVVVWVHDLRARQVRYVSNSYETLWGRPVRDLLDNHRDWIEAIVAEDRPRVEAAFVRMLTGKLYDQAYRINLPDGSQRWVHDRRVPIADLRGRPARAVGIASDVTEEERLRGRLREAVLAAQRAEVTERKRLASDLHDSVGQLLPLARMKLDELLDETGEPRLAEKAQHLGSLLAQAEEQIRTLTFRLSPVPLGEISFEAAIEQLAAIMHKRYRLVASVRDDGLEKPLDEYRAAVLFRGVRELLQNVSRHARTDKAEVRIARDGDLVLVTVEDGGVGFDAAVDSSAGFGLLSLRDRVEEVGGRLEIESWPGRGTRVRLTIPISPDASD
jgi:PAS domain S-box-containing protein